MYLANDTSSVVPTLGQTPTYWVYSRLADRSTSPVITEQRIRQAVERGNHVVRQPGATYEKSPRFEPVEKNRLATVNGVPVSVHGSTVREMSQVVAFLQQVPSAHLRHFVNTHPGGIWIVSATGAQGNPRLEGGARMVAPRWRDGICATGARIEVTHGTMEHPTRPQFTILHEMGHAVDRFLPRTVVGRYGTSVAEGSGPHAGMREQRAYAYMRYLLNPSRMEPADKSAFDCAFVRQGLTPRGANTCAAMQS